MSTTNTISAGKNQPLEILQVEDVPRKKFYLFVINNKDVLVPPSPKMSKIQELRSALGKLGLGGVIDIKRVTRTVRALVSTFSTKMIVTFASSDVYSHLKREFKIKMLEDVCFGWVGAPNDVFARLKIYENLSAASRRLPIKKRFLKASEMQRDKLAAVKEEQVSFATKEHKLQQLEEADSIRVANSNIVPPPSVFVDEKTKKTIGDGPSLTTTYRETKEERNKDKTKRVSVENTSMPDTESADNKRLAWCSKRIHQMILEYNLEAADQVQLQTLVALEWSIRQMNSRMRKLKQVDPKLIRELIDTHNLLMKSLDITRKARQDRGDEAAGNMSWEKLITFHAKHKKIRYEQCSQQLVEDYAKLRMYDEQAKCELEKMGFFGEWAKIDISKETAMNTVLGKENVNS